MKIKLLATDIDGTLTIDRSSEFIPIEAIEFMRRLEDYGVLVSLVSANALPIIVGLRRYLGLRGPVIAENGALVFINESYESLTKYSARDILEEVLRKLGDYVENSWQNDFRLHDCALMVKVNHRDKAREVFRIVREYVESRYEWVRVTFSGYAIHLTPADVDKGKALRYVMKKIGVKREEVVAIGDSLVDIDLVREAGIGVAVSNADEELKKVADLVLENPSYKGFIELARLIINDKLITIRK